jgi:hypothetical protein
MVLVEAFAHLTEVMLYRLNRLPERTYVEFLNLLGVVRHPPSAAWTELVFTRVPSVEGPISVPAGTRVSAARGADPQPVTFVVPASAVLQAGQNELRAPAYHCEIVDGALLGAGTGAAGQVLRASRTPIVTTAEERARSPVQIMVFGIQMSRSRPSQGAASGQIPRSTGNRNLQLESGGQRD